MIHATRMAAVALVVLGLPLSQLFSDSDVVHMPTQPQSSPTDLIEWHQIEADLAATLVPLLATPDLTNKALLDELRRASNSFRAIVERDDPVILREMVLLYQEGLYALPLAATLALAERSETDAGRAALHLLGAWRTGEFTQSQVAPLLRVLRNLTIRPEDLIHDFIAEDAIHFTASEWLRFVTVVAELQMEWTIDRMLPDMVESHTSPSMTSEALLMDMAMTWRMAQNMTIPDAYYERVEAYEAVPGIPRVVYAAHGRMTEDELYGLLGHVLANPSTLRLPDSETETLVLGLIIRHQSLSKRRDGFPGLELPAETRELVQAVIESEQRQ